VADTLTLAKQLGAQVFPYKGEDVVETILHVAREYRVGHIVMGKPGPLPFLKSWLGCKTLAEKLILQARGGDYCGDGHGVKARE
jgi:two-component system, OmpR family, sensor histidine kinase KdpD